MVEEYLMKLRTDQEFQNMTQKEIISAMDEINELSKTCETNLRFKRGHGI